MTAQVRTYEPDNCLKKGYLSIFKEIIDEIIDNKWLIYQLFKRDFSSMYRESFFGVLWIIIIPLINIKIEIIMIFFRIKSVLLFYT